MNLQPTLSKGQVHLRPLVSKDFRSLYAVASDSGIWEQHPIKERAELFGFTKFFAESLKSKGALLILNSKTGGTIGSTRFMLRPAFGNAVEIGWTFLSRAYWGGKCNGIVKELMIKHAVQDVDEVMLFVDKENIRSQKAVEKLDFVPKDKLIIDRNHNQRPNDIVYRVLGVG
ncbi:GNAT family N-acetyltransferase [Flagellimonas myxillae]|uniref:GNAT family N-acetyltransferase n=1 Tax=Flagellimonas myxillae TaxID=2942214 RepID=UPI00201EB8C2|nr:GNAT family N-acetyltransferase [Muricauda myxillae]MCL6264899.1 GNAT family N-acetyltransferase [Muricauda myxillae]